MRINKRIMSAVVGLLMGATPIMAAPQFKYIEKKGNYKSCRRTHTRIYYEFYVRRFQRDKCFKIQIEPKQFETRSAF